MQVGMIGLGRMGMNMSRRLLQKGHSVVAFDLNREKVKEIATERATGTNSIEELVKNLIPPRITWIMLPAGNSVEETISVLSHLLSPEDIIIDGGNSYYKDDIRRARELKEKGIRYLDIGISGGIWGFESGYCLMVGGEEKDFNYIEPLLEVLSAKGGYMYCGPSGAGHFVKMVHNGIEYVMMEAYGEGFELIKSSPYSKHLQFEKLAHLWNQGSVIRSWLLELLELAFKKDPDLSTIEGYVEDSEEGRWAVKEAAENGISTPAIAISLFKRFRSRQKETFSDKVLAALRREFGGHSVKEKP
jgi:6-phosphogluconate dehydrogenase